MSNANRMDESEDAGLEDLLREVGTRAEPPPEIAAAVRYVVHNEWQTMVAQRTRRKRTIFYAAAASILTAVIAVAALLRFTASPDGSAIAVQVASVVKVQGLLQVAEGSPERIKWRDLQAGETLVSGAVLRSGQSARAALNYNTISVRIDENTTVTLGAVDHVTLERGRVYIDAPVDRHVPLTVQTPVGAFTHLGTQYQVQIANNDVVLGVREGRVALARDHERHEAIGGEQLVIDAQGEVTRAEISPLDQRWLWAAQLAPSFEIENQSLAKFLEWVARESGKKIRYATPEVRQQAEELILRGSVGALNPQQAMQAVLATTTFTIRETATEIELRMSPAK